MLRFAWVEARCCLVAAVTLALWLAGWETGREVAVIIGLHLVGLPLALFEVRQGSWSCPDTGHASLGGVPLCNGFLYAAVGSCLCQAWRRFDLRISGYRARRTGRT